MNRLLKEINSLLSKRGQGTESATHVVHDLFQNDEIEAVFLILVTRNGKIVWKRELAVLHTYVENQAILEPIFLYRASKCKQTKEQGSEDCLWTHIFTFL